MIRLVLLIIPLSSCQLHVLWRHYIPSMICWNPIPFVFFCIWFPYLIKPDKHQGLIHPCFFLCNKILRCFDIFDSSISFTSKFIVGGNVNPSAATVRTALTCLFSEPEVQIVTDFWPFCTNDFLGTVSKILGFCLYYLSGEVDTFLSLKLPFAIFNKFLFFHLMIALQKL